MKPLATRCSTVPRSAIRAIVGKSYGMENVISFGFGQPDFTTPERIIKAGIKSLENGETFYTPNAGCDYLRAAIADEYVSRGMKYGPENVIITVGGAEALCLTMLALVDAGDEVILQDPCFANYIGMVRANGGIPVPVACTEENDFMMTAEDLKAAITPKTKAVLLNYPSNPTGAVATKENLEEVCKVCVENDLYVITDEMYKRLIYTEDKFYSPAEFPDMKERTIIVDGFSKAYAMTGWRVGYACGPEEIINNMIKMNENVVSCVNEAAQRAAYDALTGDQSVVDEMVEKYVRRRDLMVKMINENMGGKMTARTPKGAFYVFANIKKTGLTSEEFCYRLLEEKHVVTVPGTGFGDSGEGFVRFSYATSEENIEEGLKRIQAFIESL
ncbi:MAG: pyridoxal phosphate-dependent aminotransferase [Firmicutes bacterium]|nr:pyridoxal phosphate-dependent aminotransferase [Bacillota bacterium]